jgi:nicotinate-nucleotide pyrophosphorylase (carboxylating)
MTIDEIIINALLEDIGDGDHTSIACISKESKGKAKLLVKQEGVIAGVKLAKKVFYFVDKDITFEELIHDGAKIKPGDIVFYVYGKTQSLLKAERLVLNFMQRMSGIATATNQMVAKISDLKTKILDTRKTSPNLRVIEKWAVEIGGGSNHRMGLYDMIMIKDNHIDFAGGIEKAINSTHDYLKRNNNQLKIEIEARNMDDVKKILAHGGVDRIMLDNFDINDLKEAVKLINKKYETEASGGINIDTVRKVAETGVDFISVGALTHHINSLDLSLKAVL